MNVRALAPGTMCGPYEIIREIGRGGMAVVYLARSPDGHERAIKTMQFTGHLREDQLERFKLEIQLLASIDHVHVVRFYEAGKLDDETGSFIWMALEYLRGQTLREIIDERGGRISPEDVMRWGKHIADGVAAAHALRVVHRDLKPSNVSIVHDVAKVFDFGIAKFRRWGVRTTMHKARLGTMGYMAPEQLMGGQIDTRTDVYALGIILYELATGVHPLFERGAVLTVGEVIARTMTQQPRPIGELVPGFPEDLSTITLRALGKQSGDRFGTMLEMSDALNGALTRYRMKRRPLALGAISGDWHVPSSALKRTGGGGQPDGAGAASEAAGAADVAGAAQAGPATVALPETPPAAGVDAAAANTVLAGGGDRASDVPPSSSVEATVASSPLVRDGDATLAAAEGVRQSGVDPTMADLQAQAGPPAGVDPTLDDLQAQADVEASRAWRASWKPEQKHTVRMAPGEALVPEPPSGEPVIGSVGLGQGDEPVIGRLGPGDGSSLQGQVVAWPEGPPSGRPAPAPTGGRVMLGVIGIVLGSMIGLGGTFGVRAATGGMAASGPGAETGAETAASGAEGAEAAAGDGDEQGDDEADRAASEQGDAGAEEPSAEGTAAASDTASPGEASTSAVASQPASPATPRATAPAAAPQPTSGSAPQPPPKSTGRVKPVFGKKSEF